MASVQVSEFVDRVLSTDTVVPFTAADPYGHLATGRYLDMIVDHRFDAFDRQAGVNWFEIAQKQGVGYVLGEINLRMLRPLRVGSKVTVASWVTGFGKRNVSVKVLFIGPDRAAHAVARIETFAVDARTGRPIENPEMPVREGAPSVDALPKSAELLATVTGLPPDEPKS
jgi:acyl-CoA thioesterase FadM